MLFVGCAPATAGVASPYAVGAPRNEIEVRIGLVTNAATVRLGTVGGVLVYHEGRATYRLRDGETVRASAESGQIRFGGAEALYRRLQLEDAGNGRFIVVNGRPYRGSIEILASDRGLTVVNRVKLEDYLPGVVAAEMGQREARDMAALQAQAVASRTYVIYNLGRYDDQGYDIVATSSDQVYQGAGRENADFVRAVETTRGQVLAYQGRPIAAFFHSTCGASTARPDEVFATVRPQPYLQPVSDAMPDGGFYGQEAPRFQWHVEMTGTEFRDMLRRTVSRVGINTDLIGDVRDVRVHRTGPSGRVTELRVAFDHGELPIFGPDIRRVLQMGDGTDLWSTAFRLDVAKNSNSVTRVSIDGWGWGHGVGLCQWGAIGRSRLGEPYHRILQTYFPGATIARWY